MGSYDRYVLKLAGEDTSLKTVPAGKRMGADMVLFANYKTLSHDGRERQEESAGR